MDRPDAEATVVTNADGMTANLDASRSNPRTDVPCRRQLVLDQRGRSTRTPPRDGSDSHLDPKRPPRPTVLEEARAQRPRRSLRLPCLADGQPLPAFQLLAEPAYRDRVPWELVELFWADERAVGPDDPESNYRAAYDAWLRHVPESVLHRVHRMMAEAVDLDTAARHYEGELRRTVPANEDGIPVFDLIWLGMGADGHTASAVPE